MTIQAVADNAGVSTATVSRMINENGFVSEGTRKKILQAMKETGYNSAQRTRRGLSSSSLLKHRNAVLIWTADKKSQQSNTGQNLLLGIAEGLRKLNANLTVDYISSDGHIPRMLLTGAIDGIFIHGPTPEDKTLQYLKKVPVIWLLQQGSPDFGDRAQPDHAFAGEIACKHLINQECSHLCCMSYASTSASHSKYWKTREESFVTLAEINNARTSLLTHPELTEPDSTPSELTAAAKNLVADFLKLNPHPDGLYVPNMLGPYIHQELIKKGIIPMKDLLMIAGDTNFCSQHHLDPAPITTRLFSRQIGKQAVEVLLQRLKNPDMPQMTCSLKPQLLIPKDSKTA